MPVSKSITITYSNGTLEKCLLVGKSSLQTSGSTNKCKPFEKQFGVILQS